MNSNVCTFLVPSQRKTEKLKISDRIDADRSALFRIHPEFQFLFKVSGAGFKQSFGCSFAFRQKYDVIRIADYLHASAFKFLVESVKIDVGEQRRQIATLRRTFFCLCYYAVFHHSTFQVLLD